MQFSQAMLAAIDAAIEENTAAVEEIFDTIADDIARDESERKARAALVREVRENG